MGEAGACTVRKPHLLLGRRAATSVCLLTPAACAGEKLDGTLTKSVAEKQAKKKKQKKAGAEEEGAGGAASPTKPKAGGKKKRKSMAWEAAQVCVCARARGEQSGGCWAAGPRMQTQG